jgi:hypothetical protein
MGKSVEPKMLQFFTCKFIEPGASKIPKNGKFIALGSEDVGLRRKK